MEQALGNASYLVTFSCGCKYRGAALVEEPVDITGNANSAHNHGERSNGRDQYLISTAATVHQRVKFPCAECRIADQEQRRIVGEAIDGADDHGNFHLRLPRSWYDKGRRLGIPLRDLPVERNRVEMHYLRQRQEQQDNMRSPEALIDTTLGRSTVLRRMRRDWDGTIRPTELYRDFTTEAYEGDTLVHRDYKEFYPDRDSMDLPPPSTIRTPRDRYGRAERPSTPNTRPFDDDQNIGQRIAAVREHEERANGRHTHRRRRREQEPSPLREETRRQHRQSLSPKHSSRHSDRASRVSPNADESIEQFEADLYGWSTEQEGPRHHFSHSEPDLPTSRREIRVTTALTKDSRSRLSSRNDERDPPQEAEPMRRRRRSALRSGGATFLRMFGFRKGKDK